MSANEGDGDSTMQKFELYIKASAIDKETKGADPICQQFFMMTCLLGENQDDIDFKVFTVQADCPPKNFAAGWSKKYPVVMVNSGRNKAGQDISDMMYDTFEELELFFESINKECPELKRKNAPNISAMAVVENVYKHFNHFISGQAEKALLTELKKVNEHLEAQETKFLVDNVLSFADCHLLPRLQHIRVASKAYRGFDIPKEFSYIWKYLKNAYEQDAFKSTMPSDQDIVFFYEKKAGGPPRSSGGKRGGKPTLEKFTYTMDVPDDCLNGLDNGTSQAEQVPEEDSPPASEPAPADEALNGVTEDAPTEVEVPADVSPDASEPVSEEISEPVSEAVAAEPSVDAEPSTEADASPEAVVSTDAEPSATAEASTEAAAE